MLKIEVNNNGYVEIEESGYGIRVTSCDADGTVERKDGFTEGEIIMILNLLRYMRDSDTKSVYLFDEYTRNYLDNLLRHGDIEEFRIFQ